MNTTAKIIVALILAAIIIAGVWFWGGKKAPTASIQMPQEKSSGLGSDIYSKVAPTSAQSLPEINPFKAVQTNPFGQ